MQSQHQCVRIVHLEDDSRDATLFEAALKASGIAYAITRATTQNELVAALQQGVVDLIIADSGLPGFDTFKALSLVKEERPEVPFVFYTGNSSPKLKADAFANGAENFFSKDHPDALIQLVRQLWRTKVNKRVKVSQKLPETGRIVVAHCSGFRCLAFRDHEGQWRNAFHKEELLDVIEWYED